MSDLFEIAPRRTGRTKNGKAKEEALSRYTELQADFLTRSYGYYATYFIQKIAGEAKERTPESEVAGVAKVLRQMVRKMLLSDLELVFVGYVAGQLQWAFSKPFYRQHHLIFKPTSEQLHKSTQYITLFLLLCATFVKSYIGQLEEAASVSELLANETEGAWQGVYEEWVRSLPGELFRLSPRAINCIFSDYSRDCQRGTHSKNYNCMVDRILELSTTYSMIPGQAKKRKRPHEEEQEEEEEETPVGRKVVKKVERVASSLTKKQESSINEPLFQESRLSSNFLEPNRPKDPPPSQAKQGAKRSLLRLKSKKQQVTNHISQFYSKKQYQLPGREEYRPDSTLGFQNSIPSLLDFSNNRSSVYQVIPYTLRNNSNLSNFWK